MTEEWASSLEGPDDGWLTGMDVPLEPWNEDDVWFWSGSRRYQPWKDVAAFFGDRDRRV